MKFCTNCGSKISENAKFCTNCGTRFEEKPAAVPEPVAVVPEQPVHEVFEQPAYEAPVQPAYEAPAQPVYEVPEQPAYQEPSQPVYQPQEGSFGDPVAEVSEEKRTDRGKKPANKRLLVIGAVAAVIAIIALVIGLVGGGSGADGSGITFENGTVNATGGGNREKYTIAMDVGFGVIDMTREGNGNTCTFDYQGTILSVSSATPVA